MLPPDGFSYGLPHHTPPSHPREPGEAARTSQKNPFPSPPRSQRCSPPAQDEVWRVQKKGVGTKYSWREPTFIFHPFPRQQTLHSPCLLPVSPLPHLLLAPPLPVFAERPREPGQVCSPELCARGLWPHQPCPQHGGGLAVPPQALQGCCPPAVTGAGSSSSRTPGCGTVGVACRAS